METKVAIECGDALMEAWQLLNTMPKGDCPVDIHDRLNYHAQQLMPGPYRVVIKYEIDNVGDDPGTRLVLDFDADASEAEITLFKLRYF